MEARFTARDALRRLLCCVLLATLLIGAAGTNGTVVCSQPVFTDEERRWIDAHPVVRVAAEPDWHPLEYVRNGKHEGLVAGYLGTISRMTGLTFQTVPNTPWGRAYQALESGKVDLLPSMWRELAGDRFGDRVLVSSPYLVGRLTTVTRNDATTIYTLRQLAGRRVALKGQGSIEYFARHGGAALDVRTFDTDEHALAAVADGRADVALGFDITLLPLLRRQFQGRLFVSGMLTDRPVSLAMLTRADTPILASIVDKSLAAIPVDEMEAMNRHWIRLADYGKPTLLSILRYCAPQVLAIGMTLLAFALLAYLSWKSRAAAIRSERDKALFLAFVSHEIRTPMHTVLSSLELLQCARPGDVDRQASSANAAISASETLLTLLDDIIDYSRLESRKIMLAPEAVELGPWARQSVDLVRWRADEKQLPLTLDLACPAALTVMIDPVRVRQIVVNLLINAIKFTSVGSVSLRIDYLPGPHARHGMLTFQVRDTGIGIPPERREHIFDAYWQAEHPARHAATGSGLGLAICHELVHLMHGTIAVDSTPQVETTMTVRLPVAVAALPAPDDGDAPPRPCEIAPPARIAAARGTMPLVLVVDDQEAVQLAIRRQCDALRCRTVFASTGRDALRLFARTRFDLVLLDCNLPDIDGYAVARLIRQDESARDTAHVPIIAISATADDAHKVRCFESGMDGVLGKPLRLQALRQMIAMWCPACVSAPPDEPVAPANGGCPVDLGAVYLRTVGEDLDRLATTLLSRDISGALRMIHRIKGASHVAGLHDLAQLFEPLENRLRQLDRTHAEISK